MNWDEIISGIPQPQSPGIPTPEELNEIECRRDFDREMNAIRRAMLMDEHRDLCAIFNPLPEERERRVEVEARLAELERNR